VAEGRGGRAAGRRVGVMALDDLRRRVDELDEQLVTLLNARAACALEIGLEKEALGLEMYQPQREADVLRHVRAASRARGGPLDDEAIARLFERIIDEARRLEITARRRRREAVESRGEGERTAGTDARERPADGRPGGS